MHKRLLFILFLIGSLSTVGPGRSSAADKPGCKINCDSRAASARKIIQEERLFIERGRDLVAQIEQSVSDAQKLQQEAGSLQNELPSADGDAGSTAQTSSSITPEKEGQPASEQPAAAKRPLTGAARKYTNVTKPVPKLLTGARLDAAKKQYSADLAKFANHVKAYREHTRQVRLQLGECEASKKAFEKLSDEYKLHCDEFHMPDVPPPHICVELGTTTQEANQVIDRMRETMRRVLHEESRLAASEQRLQNANAFGSAVDAHVRKQYDLNLQEQELVAEYARLREEHRLLNIEKDVITASGAKVGVGTVSARLKRPSPANKR